jgi:cytochrome b
MNTLDTTIGAGGVTPPATIKVWDPLVRVFHWSLATLFLAAYLTGEDAGQVHIAAGYAIAGLIALRIVWGFVGPRHARFSNFVRSPREVLAYLRDVALLRAPRYLGHNPAGGAMILVLLTLVGITGLSGWLSETDRFFAVGWIEDLHSFSAYALIAFVGLHVAGVIASSLLHRENLVRAMITGKKQR